MCARKSLYLIEIPSNDDCAEHEVKYLCAVKLINKNMLVYFLIGRMVGQQ